LSPGPTECAGKPMLRLVVSEGPTATPTEDDDEPVAEVRGINVHAEQRVDGRDRAQIERLCSYITRPPLSQERLTRRVDVRRGGRRAHRSRARVPDGRPGVVRIRTCLGLGSARRR